MKQRGWIVYDEENYEAVSLSVLHRLTVALVTGVAAAALMYLFYRLLWLSALCIPIGFLFVKPYKKALCKKRKRRFCTQFKDMLYFISASLSAGQSVERAFSQAQDDLQLHYAEDSDIIREIRRVNNEVALHVPLETSLESLARRTHIDDVQNFAQVFSVCYRVGGSATEMVRTTGRMIAEKIETKEEIETVLTEKKTESKVVMAAPVVGILMLGAIAEEYMAPLFTTPEGRVAMTVTLALTCVASLLACKLARIEV